MGTFVEFYMTLLGFVNFRLYTSIGLKYPPKFDETKDDQAGGLGAFTLEGVNLASDADGANALADGAVSHEPNPAVQAEVDKVVQELRATDPADGDKPRSAKDAAEDEPAADGFDKFEPVAPGGDLLPQPSYSTQNPGALFSKCTFFLSRETPRQPLEFILRAFGCKRVGWDAVLGDGAFTTDELDPTITHQVVDRPVVQAAVNPGGDGEDNQTSQKLGSNKRVVGRIYVQPQWVWDSVNDEELMRPDLYAPGAQLPPHLSPFVKSVQGQYDPTMPLDEQETEAEALEAASDSDEVEDEGEQEEVAEDDGQDSLAVKPFDDADGEMDVANSDSETDEADQANDDTFGGFSDGEAGADDSDDEEASAALQRQRELEAELTGKPVRSQELDPKVKAKAEARKALERKTKEQEEELNRAKGMLAKKKRRLYDQMVYGNSKRSSEDEKLRAKRRKIERELSRDKP